jgi:hypothetical protein
MTEEQKPSIWARLLRAVCVVIGFSTVFACITSGLFASQSAAESIIEPQTRDNPVNKELAAGLAVLEEFNGDAVFSDDSLAITEIMDRDRTYQPTMFKDNQSSKFYKEITHIWTNGCQAYYRIDSMFSAPGSRTRFNEAKVGPIVSLDFSGRLQLEAKGRYDNSYFATEVILRGPNAVCFSGKSCRNEEVFEIRADTYESCERAKSAKLIPGYFTCAFPYGNSENASMAINKRIEVITKIKAMCNK